MSPLAGAEASQSPSLNTTDRGLADSAPATRSALVLGGGLAGIAAAVRLAQCGVRVTLIETSRRLGGRATSHDDPATGQTLDNCQHVVMGCCTALIDLYERLGVDRHIDWHSRLHFFDKSGQHDVLEGNVFLPAPLHLSPSMLRMHTLTLRERLAVSRAMLAMLRMGNAGREELESVTFTRWLRSQGQPQGAIDKFWAVVVVSALNQHPDRASAPAAIHVFQDGFLAHEDAYLMGTASVPLRMLYDPAVPLIEAAGGRVMLGSSVKRLAFDGKNVTGVELADGSTFAADWYISALPFDRLEKVANDALKAADPRFRGLDQFTHSPILGIHLWFDRPVVEWPHMIFVDSPLQWAFTKGADPRGYRVQGSEREPQYLHCVISAADEWMDQSQDQIIDMAVRELAAYGPAVRGATLQRGRVIKEKRATFSPVPGIDQHRPTTRGLVENLLLAGDWTDTGWPATMEGAARSGYAAAAAVVSRIQAVPDLPRSRLTRWMSR